MLSGYSVTPDYRSIASAFRFLASGTIDTGYGDGGTAALGDGEARGLLVEPGGHAYIGHSFGKITALDTAGRMVSRFSGEALRRKRPSMAVAVLIRGPGETVLVVGDGAVARLRGDGRLDRRFGDDGLLYGSPLQGAGRAPDRPTAPRTFDPRG